MSRVIIADTQAAGNASLATVFTMPADFAGSIGSIIACNTTAGGLTLTLKVTRNGTDNMILNVDAIGASAVNYYGPGATVCLCPLALNAGDVLKAQGSGAGINVTISGLRFSIT